MESAIRIVAEGGVRLTCELIHTAPSMSTPFRWADEDSDSFYDVESMFSVTVSGDETDSDEQPQRRQRTFTSSQTLYLSSRPSIIVESSPLSRRSSLAAARAPADADVVALFAESAEKVLSARHVRAVPDVQLIPVEAPRGVEHLQKEIEMVPCLQSVVVDARELIHSLAHAHIGRASN